MDSLLILIPVALVFVAIAVKAFMWAVDNHQYDDLDAAAESILFDDVEVKVDSKPHHAGTITGDSSDALDKPHDVSSNE